jgi:ABC-type multidrug transport system fused ATPase/permease subunit
MFMLVGMIISISIVNWPCLVVIVPSVIIFLLVYKTFKKVFPQVKRIESISRSPVFSACNETMDCLVTIRAFSEQQHMLDMFREASNFSCSAFFMQQGVMRWMTFRMGILTSCFALLITVLAILIAPYS